jgi:predicted lipoprotein with Yx(FWY)xxD motif
LLSAESTAAHGGLTALQIIAFTEQVTVITSGLQQMLGTLISKESSGPANAIGLTAMGWPALKVRPKRAQSPAYASIARKKTGKEWLRQAAGSGEWLRLLRACRCPMEARRGTAQS